MYCQIELTGSSIPLSIASLTAEQAFETRDVIQPSVAEYLHALDPRYHEANRGCSLLSIRLTTLLPSRQSVLGITWAHILGDASTFNLFTQHFSFLYTNGTGTCLSPQQMPTFFPHIAMPAYPPSQEVLDTYDIKQIYPTHAIADQRKAWTEALAASEQVLISISRAELDTLVREFTLEGAEFVSTHDILSAWWVSILQRTGYQVKSLIYTINVSTQIPMHAARWIFLQYRGFHRGTGFFPPNLPTLAGDVAQMLKVELPTPPGPLTKIETAGVARAIRSALNEMRQDPQAIIDWLSSLAHRLEQAAEQGRCHLVLPGADEALVNSNFRYSFLS
jgi:hypothetical protein